VIGSPDVEALAGALADPLRSEAALRLCDEWWSIAVARALARTIHEAREPVWRARLVSTLAGLYRRYPVWTGSWFGPTPLAGKRPAKTEDWEPEGMTTVCEGLLAALDDPEPAVRRQAIEGLIQVGQRVLPRLRRALGDERDPSNLMALVHGIGQLGDEESVPLLTRLLGEPRLAIEPRLAAVEAVEKIQGLRARPTLIDVASTAGSPASLRARAISLMGRDGGIPEPALAGFLALRDPMIRTAALVSVADSGTSPAALRRAIGGSLDDDSAEVRSAAIKAVASIKIAETAPRLLELAHDGAFRADAIRALSAVPDPRALSVYVQALDDPSSEVRKAAETALKAIRDRVTAELNALAHDGRLSDQAALPLEPVLSSFRPIVDWRVIGPFPSNMGQPFADPSAIDFCRQQRGAGGRSIAWERTTADPSTGKVVIDDLKRGGADPGNSGIDPRVSPDLVAVAVGDVVSAHERSALLLAGSSGTITITVNGTAALHTDSDAGRPFSPASDSARLRLNAGTNRIMVQVRQGIGPWSFSVQVSDTAAPDLVERRGTTNREGLRSYALTHQGQARRGEALFFVANGIGCARCHSAGGRGQAQIGPDLTGLSSKYNREEIIRSILEPSSRIASGFQSVVLARTDGTVLTGLLRAESADHLDLIGADLNPIRVPTSDIEERRVGNVSLMPTGLVDSLSPAQFADLIAYLESLRP
jgi:putative heme-binding domain-containing protein